MEEALEDEQWEELSCPPSSITQNNVSRYRSQATGRNSHSLADAQYRRWTPPKNDPRACPSRHFQEFTAVPLR
jgi:hypothetical protein